MLQRLKLVRNSRIHHKPESYRFNMKQSFVLVFAATYIVWNFFNDGIGSVPDKLPNNVVVMTQSHNTEIENGGARNQDALNVKLANNEEAQSQNTETENDEAKHLRSELDKQLEDSKLLKVTLHKKNGKQLEFVHIPKTGKQPPSICRLKARAFLSALQFRFLARRLQNVEFGS